MDTFEYREGRGDGLKAFHQFGIEIADQMVVFLGTLDKNSLYALGFAKSVSEALTDSLS